MKHYQSKEKDALKAVWDNATVHTRGMNPERLLGLRRPSEPEDIMQYRLGVYEPITRPDFRQAITDAKAALMGGKARIVLGEKMTGELAEARVGGLDFMKWYREKAISLMFEDPNASIVFWPTNPGTGEKIELDIFLYNSFAFAERRLDFLKWEAGKTEDGKTVYNAVDTENFWVITGEGKEQTAEVWYRHGTGYLPVVYEMGGVPAQTEDGFEYLDSYLGAAIAWGNKAIRYDSDLEGAKTLTAYPIRQIEEEPCVNPVCNNGWYFNEKTQQKAVCGSCNGKGVHIPSGAFAYIVKRKSNDVTGEGAGGSGDALTYITPPVEGLRFLSDDFDKTFAEMKRSLNQIHTVSAQSGAAKEIDREGKYAGIDAIAANVWGNIKKSFEIIRDLKYWPIQVATGQKETVEVSLPATFNVPSEQELASAATAMATAGDRLGALKATSEIQERKYAGEPAHLKALKFWETYDPFYGLTLEDKLNYATAGLGDVFGFTPEDFIRSGKGFAVLLRLRAEPGFAEMDMETIRKEVDKRLGITE